MRGITHWSARSRGRPAASLVRHFVSGHIYALTACLLPPHDYGYERIKINPVGRRSKPPTVRDRRATSLNGLGARARNI